MDFHNLDTEFLDLQAFTPLNDKDDAYGLSIIANPGCTPSPELAPRLLPTMLAGTSAHSAPDVLQTSDLWNWHWKTPATNPPYGFAFNPVGSSMASISHTPARSMNALPFSLQSATTLNPQLHLDLPPLPIAEISASRNDLSVETGSVSSLDSTSESEDDDERSTKIRRFSEVIIEEIEAKQASEVKLIDIDQTADNSLSAFMTVIDSYSQQSQEPGENATFALGRTSSTLSLTAEAASVKKVKHCTPPISLRRRSRISSASPHAIRLPPTPISPTKKMVKCPSPPPRRKRMSPASLAKTRSKSVLIGKQATQCRSPFPSQNTFRTVAASRKMATALGLNHTYQTLPSPSLSASTVEPASPGYSPSSQSEESDDEYLPQASNALKRQPKCSIGSGSGERAPSASSYEAVSRKATTNAKRPHGKGRKKQNQVAQAKYRSKVKYRGDLFVNHSATMTRLVREASSLKQVKSGFTALHNELIRALQELDPNFVEKFEAKMAGRA